MDDGPDEADEMDDEAAAALHTPSWTDDTNELVVYNAFPSTFWGEVAHDDQLGAILGVDVAPSQILVVHVQWWI